MLLHKKKIRGLLSFYEVRENEEEGFMYLLQHQRSCIEMLESKRMDCEFIETMIHSLVGVMESVDEYLLDPSNLVIEMAYIFGEGSGWQFVYIPGYGVDFWFQLEKLGEEWLNYVDYSNEKAVLWAYTFYQKVHHGGCSLTDLLDVLKMEAVKENHVRTNALKEEVSESMPMPKKEVSQKKKKQSLFQRIKNRGTSKEKRDFCFDTTVTGDTDPLLCIPENSEPIRNRGEKVLVFIPMNETESEPISMDHFPFLIGRAPDETDFYMESPKISRIHARIESDRTNTTIIDLQSANGTYRNEERLQPGQAYALHTGDVVRLADLEFICQWC